MYDSELKYATHFDPDITTEQGLHSRPTNGQNENVWFQDPFFTYNHREGGLDYDYETRSLHIIIVKAA